MSSTSVPLADPKAQYLSIREVVDSAIRRVLDKGNYVMGGEVEAFEEEWAATCGAKYCIGVSSGTDAIMLTFKALAHMGELKEYQDVHTPAFTFYATSQALIDAGLCPEFHDVRMDNAIMESIYPGGVNLVVSMYGHPQPWSGENIIEDMAHAHGQELKGRAGCFSFYPTKNLGAIGQAGAVVTSDEDLAKMVRHLRVYGETQRFVYDKVSGNYRMDELQAAILRAKLPHLGEWTRRRRQIARRYIQEIGKRSLQVNFQKYDPLHVYHIFAVKVSRPNDVAKYLATWGIQTSIRYPVPMHLQPSLSHLGHKRGDFPHAEAWAEHNLSLPMYPELTDEQVEHVIKTVNQYFQYVSEVGR